MGLIITLIAIGLLLIAIEVLIIPGIGIAGILGVLSLIGAVFVSFSMYGATTGLIILGAIIFILIIFTWVILRSNTWKKLTLNDSIKSKVNTTIEENSLTIGEIGTVTARLSPIGKVRFKSTEAEVKSLEGIINSGETVKIIKIEDNTIIVKLID
jgi:membrane-bound ClpP family serine protease